jgi:hypothetical protein
MTQSPELTAFYRAYAAWLDEGAPENKSLAGKTMFSRRLGLCSNLINYAEYHHLGEERLEQLEDELWAQFEGQAYPFNSNSGCCYGEESVARTMHLNLRRVAWVRAHCEEAQS